MDKNFWPQLLLGVVSMVASIAGTKMPGFEWLLYLGGFMLVFSGSIIIWNSSLKKIILNQYYLRRDKKILALSDSIHWELIKKLHVADELIRELNGINWNNNRPCGLHSLGNTFALINRQLDGFDPSRRIIAANLTITEIINLFDMWLSVCDQILKIGGAQYEDEAKKNKVIKLVSRYEKEVGEYRQFCIDRNSKLHSVQLINIYNSEHCFNWISSLKSTKPIELKV